MTPTLKTIVIGCVRSSAVALEALVAHPWTEICALVTLRENAANSDFVNLTPIAERARIPVFYAEDLCTEALADLFRETGADIGFVVGWSHLIPEAVLQVPRLGLIGYHPAALPKYRGRHPIIWSITLGLKWTASTFFVMEKGADSGPILSQETIHIGSRETSGSLYDKLIGIMPKQIAEIVNGLRDGSIQPIPQDHSQATYWRKRTRSDGLIDWRMSSIKIDRLVRALSSPYPGAEMIVDGKKYRVDYVQPLNVHVDGCEPGRVLNVSDDGTLIHAGEGSILIIDTSPKLNVKKGDCL